MSVLKFPSQKLNKKNSIIFIIICSITLIFLILSIIYAFNPSFREFVDIYIFRKEINSDNLAIIELSSDDDQFLCAYDKYIAVLNKKILYTYNSSGENIATNDVNVTSPIFDNNNKFLAIGEKNGNIIYLISGTNIIWQNTLEGNITNISVNKNGYVSVILSGTSYRSIVVSFDSKGKELFKTYLSNNLAISTEISNDNKYLSVAELDYSGSIIKSTIKNISIEIAKTDPTNSVIYTYNLNDNELLTNIKYQDKNTLICLSNTNIYLLNVVDCIENVVMPINNNYEFIDINLKNNFIYTFNNNQNFKNISHINIFNPQTKSNNSYQFKGSIKSIYANNEKIAINTGSSIHFLGLNGWLIKKYDSYNEINTVLLGDSIVGIIYKNKIMVMEI